MNGLETWKQVMNQPKVIANVINKAKMKKKKIDLFIFHQANRNLLQYLSTKLGIDKSKTFLQYLSMEIQQMHQLQLRSTMQLQKVKLKSSVVLISGVGAGFVFEHQFLKY